MTIVINALKSKETSTFIIGKYILLYAFVH